MKEFTPQEVVALFIELLDRQQHIRMAQENIEEAFAGLPEARQRYVSPSIGAYLSIFLQQQKHIQVIQRKIEKILAGAGKAKAW